MELLTGGIDQAVASIRDRKPGSVNWHGAVRDFRGVLDGSWPIAAARDDPLFGPYQILYFLRDSHEDKVPAIGRLKKKKIGQYLSAISVRKEGPVTWRGGIRDFRIALWESWLVATASDGPCPRRPSFPGANCDGESPFLFRHSHSADGPAPGCVKRGE